MRDIKNYCETTIVPWCLLGGLSLLSLAGALLYVIKPEGEQVFRWLFGIGVPAGTLLYAWLCFRGSGKFLKPARLLSPALRTSRRFCPALLGIALAFFALSILYWFINVVVIGQMPVYPSFQQYITFLVYPCLICVFLFLPSHHLSVLSRVRIFLDSLIILTALTTLYYYFILAPILMESTGTLQAKIVASIFPEADLVLFFCLLLVVLRGSETALRPVLIFLGISTMTLFISHVIHLSEVLSSAYTRFSMGDAVLFLNSVLTVGAAQTLRRMLDRSEASAEVRSPANIERADHLYPTERWKTILPSSLVLAFGLVVFIVWMKGGSKNFPGEILIVYIGAFLVLLLMVLRQFLAVYEINRLQSAVRRRNRSLGVLNEQLERLATIDTLTGLPNHRALAYLLNTE
ncbi:MAG: hypothetical protein ACRDHW_13485, partial [Ktedonobacteraceae bacterium]